MKKLTVEAAIIPIETGIGAEPSVRPEDKITDAIEVMLKNDLNRVAVTRESTVIGMIRLEDAFEKIGLEGDLKAKAQEIAKRIIVVQGRKIIVDEMK
ncbi:MAG: CBS domain-containing protein [Desulfobacterales bacterium]|nr:CBS domain-containing protein [Desulfobacterales bacterium]